MQFNNGAYSTFHQRHGGAFNVGADTMTKTTTHITAFIVAAFMTVATQGTMLVQLTTWLTRRPGRIATRPHRGDAGNRHHHGPPRPTRACRPGSVGVAAVVTAGPDGHSHHRTAGPDSAAVVFLFHVPSMRLVVDYGVDGHTVALTSRTPLCAISHAWIPIYFNDRWHCFHWLYYPLGIVAINDRNCQGLPSKEKLVTTPALEPGRPSSSVRPLAMERMSGQASLSSCCMAFRFWPTTGQATATVSAHRPVRDPVPLPMNCTS